MNETILYMAPGTCARVSMTALEELGVPFETQVVRFMKGEHKSPEYKRFNPKGKVPALVHDGETLTENVAIITYLNDRYGGLLPETGTPTERARQLADLCFCATTLHPLVTRIRMPHMFAGESAAGAVRERANTAMDEYFQLIEERMGDQEWWYGTRWSAMDAYLYWVFWRVEGADYTVARFPKFSAHAQRSANRPAARRAMEREHEHEAEQLLKEEGLVFVPPPVK